MDKMAIALGAFFILLGFLVKKFPNLLAGYNTMTKEQKEKVDVDGLTTFARNSFIITGALITLALYVLRFIGFENYYEIVQLVIIVVGVIIMVAGAQKYDHN